VLTHCFLVQTLHGMMRRGKRPLDAIGNIANK
jgi:hypothetical protein